MSKRADENGSNGVNHLKLSSQVGKRVAQNSNAQSSTPYESVMIAPPLLGLNSTEYPINFESDKVSNDSNNIEMTNSSMVSNCNGDSYADRILCPIPKNPQFENGKENQFNNISVADGGRWSHNSAVSKGSNGVNHLILSSQGGRRVAQNFNAQSSTPCESVMVAPPLLEFKLTEYPIIFESDKVSNDSNNIGMTNSSIGSNRNGDTYADRILCPIPKNSHFENGKENAGNQFKKISMADEGRKSHNSAVSKETVNVNWQNEIKYFCSKTEEQTTASLTLIKQALTRDGLQFAKPYQDYFLRLASTSISCALQKFLVDESFFNKRDHTNRTSVDDVHVHGRGSSAAYTQQNHSAFGRDLPDTNQNQPLTIDTAANNLCLPHSNPQSSGSQLSDLNSKCDLSQQEKALVSRNNLLETQQKKGMIKNTKQKSLISKDYHEWKHSTAITSHSANVRDIPNHVEIHASNENQFLQKLSTSRSINGQNIEQQPQSTEMDMNNDDCVMTKDLELTFTNDDADIRVEDNQSKRNVSPGANTESNPLSAQSNRMIRVSMDCEQQLDVDGESFEGQETALPELIDLISDYEEEASKSDNNVANDVEKVAGQSQPMIQRGKRKNEGTTANEHLKKKRKITNAVNTEKRHKCDICEYSTDVKSNLTRHTRTHSDEQLYACEICFKRFTLKSGLNSHKKTHIYMTASQCFVGSLGFSDEKTLKKHKSRCKAKQYNCYLCHKNCYHRGYLEDHMRKHTGQKLPCSKCHKRFNSKWGLTLHMKTHAKLFQFQCLNCHQGFTHKEEWSMHESRCKAKQYNCYLCHKKCYHRGYLEDHMRKHTGQKLPCSKCHKRFNSKWGLTLHMKTHAKLFQFQCLNCHQGFTHKEEWSMHESRCKAIQYECHFCHKKYYDHKSHLVDHMRRKHTGEKPFCCSVCHKHFCARFELTRHLKHRHKKGK